MGIVVALRFNEKMGALISDEETWNLRFRRKDYLDNIHRLIEGEAADELGLEVAYAGTGYSSLHTEVVDKTRTRLTELWAGRGSDGIPNPPFKTVEDVSRIALEMLHAVIRRRIDLRLNFFYGFTSVDLIQGSFNDAGKSIEIKQEAVHDKALKIATGEEEGRLSKAWFKSRATTFGYDRENGITGYFLDPQKFVMCYNYEGWDAFGAGKYASGVVLAQYINRKPLLFRRKGFDPSEGLLQLLNAAQTATETFQESGGDLSIVLIDAHKTASQQKYIEIFDARAKLANEIAFGWRKGFIDQKRAQELIGRLIFQKEKSDKIESEMMKKIAGVKAFELALRGYKLDEIPQILNTDPAETHSKA